MTLQQLSEEYANSITLHKTFCKADYLAGANAIMDIVTDLIHQLQEEGKGLWAASYVLDLFDELKNKEL